MSKLVLLLLLIISCGKEKSDSKKKVAEEFDEDGMFYGTVEPYNRNPIRGHIKITKSGDSIQAEVKLKGLSAGNYEQILHEKSFCPRTDLDGNGVIDASEVLVDAGARMLAFAQGVQESSYHLMLADIGRRVINFEERIVIVYKEADPIGCAPLDKIIEVPSEPSPPERPTRPRRPSRPRSQPEIEPPPPPPPAEEGNSWWDRLSDRLRQWWCRVRRRCA